MAFEAAMTVSDRYHSDENNETHAGLRRIFCGEFTICHYFNEACNPMEKLRHLIKLSKRYVLYQNGWVNFSWSFYFDTWIEIKRVEYCFKFTSILPAVFNQFQFKNKDIEWRLSTMSLISAKTASCSGKKLDDP